MDSFVFWITTGSCKCLSCCRRSGLLFSMVCIKGNLGGKSTSCKGFENPCPWKFFSREPKRNTQTWCCCQLAHQLFRFNLRRIPHQWLIFLSFFCSLKLDQRRCPIVIDRKSLHKLGCQETTSFPGYKYFLKILQNHFSNVVFPKSTILGKCDFCVRSSQYVALQILFLIM